MELTDEEKQRAAMACRAAAAIAEKDAQGQSSPGIRATFEEQAEKYRALAVRFDAARSSAGEKRSR
jgi:hypothetical protein